MVKIFVNFFSLNMGSELELEMESWNRSRPLFHVSGQKGRLRLHNTGKNYSYLTTAPLFWIRINLLDQD